MTIKYAEITIIRNIEEEHIFTTLTRYFGYENNCNDNDTIIINFDDGYICDIKDEYTDKKYIFTLYSKQFPIYFEKNKKDTLFWKYSIDNILHVNTMFKNHKSYKLESSIYNMIYYHYCRGIKKDIFSILRIKSNEDKPRFILAYDDILFDKSDIIYLTDCIFKERFD